MTDKFGARIMAFMLVVLFWIGLLLLCISVTYYIDQLLYVSYVFLAHATWIGGLLTVQTGMYFKNDTTRNRVIFILNSVFDSGAVTYLGLWSIGQGLNKDIIFLSWSYLGLSILILGPAFYFWAVTIPAHQEENAASSATVTKSSSPQNDGSNEEDPSSCIGVKKITSGDIPSSNTLTVMDQSETIEVGVAVVRDANSKKLDSSRQTASTITSDEDNGSRPSPPVSDGKHLTNLPSTQSPSPMTPDAKDPESTNPRLDGGDIGSSNDGDDMNRYILVSERTPFQQITSVPNLMISMFFALHAASNQFTLTSTRDFLAILGDDEIGNRYLTIFTLLTPASLLALPLVDTVLLRCGLHGAFQTINALALSYLIIRILNDQLNGLQIFGFLIFSCYRCFLFGITMSSLPTLLAPHVVGKATGLNFLMAGVVSALNIPLANWTILKWNGNFRIPNLVYGGLLTSCIVSSWVLERYMRLERREKQRQREAKESVNN